MPADCPLDILHDTLQIAFGWSDYHLHLFNAAGRKYGLPDPDLPEMDIEREEETRLNDALMKPKSKMIYEYDFGDRWAHEIVLEKIIADEASGIDDIVFEIAAGSLATEGAIACLFSNPTRSDGFFFDTHHNNTLPVGRKNTGRILTFRCGCNLNSARIFNDIFINIGLKILSHGRVEN